MSASEFMRRNFFKKMGSLLSQQTATSDQIPNSVIAFFIEDFLFQLEEQNQAINLDDAALVDRQSKALLKNFSKHRDIIPALTFEVKFQQRIISIVSDQQASHPLDGQLAELEQQIQAAGLQKNSKTAKKEADHLVGLVQRHILLMQVLALDGLVSKAEVESQSDLVAKTFESALPAEDLVKFAELEYLAKARHLQELHLIHTGITIFKNEFDALGDQASPPAPGRPPLIATFAEPSFADRTANLLRLIEEIESRDCNEMDFNEQIQLKLVWQKFIQIKNLLDAEFVRLVELRNKGNAEVERLIEAARRPTQTLKTVIFPIFSELGQTYKTLLVSRRKIIKLLDFVAEFEGMLAQKLRPLPRLSSASKLESSKEAEPFRSSRFKLVSFDSAEVARVQLAYNGICLVSLVCDGTLLYGNPAEAILFDTVRNLHLCFLTRDKAAEFLKDPEQVYDHVRQALTDYKMLMFLMDYEALQKYSFFIETVSEEVRAESLKCFNVGIQTPAHFQERFIDHGYFWNEWDLRRQAIKMANIRNKKTIGCQTGNSYFKVNNETQIWPLKDQSSMTEVEKGTNPIWPRNYIVGLRSVDTK